MIGLKYSSRVLLSCTNGVNRTCSYVSTMKFCRKVENGKCSPVDISEESSMWDGNPEIVKSSESTVSVVHPKLKRARKSTSDSSSDCEIKSNAKKASRAIKSPKHREYYIQNALFGKLLETQKQRKAQLSMPDDAKKSIPPDNQIDTEYFYMTKSVSSGKQGPFQFAKIRIINKKSVGKSQSGSILKIQACTAQDTPTNTKHTSKPEPSGNSNVIKEIPLYPITGKTLDSDSPIETQFLGDRLNDPNTYPSVTAILNETMSSAARQALERWKERMILKLGPEGFEKYQEELLQDGRNFHACVQNTLMQKEVSVEPRIQLAYNSVQNILKDVHDVVAVETAVSHPHLKYKGIVDCIASFRGEAYIIDWKKSNRAKLTLATAYDAPTQLAAYIGAICASDEYRSLRIGKGLIVFAYTNGTPATFLSLTDESLEKHWKIWLSRLKMYHEDPKRSYNVAENELSTDVAEIVV